jgi:hypothetical protein
MKRLAVCLVVACGGGAASTSSTLENKATGPLLPIASGSYPCEFMYGDYPMGPYRCVVQGNRIKKERGLEFVATLVPHGDAIEMDAEITCAPGSYYTDICHSKFTVQLIKMGNGLFRGKITDAGKLDTYGLTGQAFQITNAGMGGDQYGGAGYGGYNYGGG